MERNRVENPQTHLGQAVKNLPELPEPSPFGRAVSALGVALAEFRGAPASRFDRDAGASGWYELIVTVPTGRPFGG